MSETSNGFGRVIVALYAVFAIAATSRSLYQISTRFDEAPLPYILSAVAGLIYVAATIALGTGHSATAYVAISIELVGVLVVGTLTVLDGQLFADATVWSDFGQGYGYVPLVLPIAGLWWLHHVRS